MRCTDITWIAPARERGVGSREGRLASTWLSRASLSIAGVGFLDGDEPSSRAADSDRQRSWRPCGPPGWPRTHSLWHNRLLTMHHLSACTTRDSENHGPPEPFRRSAVSRRGGCLIPLRRQVSSQPSRRGLCRGDGWRRRRRCVQPVDRLSWTNRRNCAIAERGRTDLVQDDSMSLRLQLIDGFLCRR
jgi:hypothetical protein